MLEVKTRNVILKLESDDIRSVLTQLSSDGWQPAIAGSENHFMKLASVDDKLGSSELRLSTYPYYGREPVIGDVFFKDRDTYYLAYSLSQDMIDGFESRVFYRGTTLGEPKLEVGILTPFVEDVDKRLESFVQVIESAVRKALDGRKTRYMNFDWQGEANTFSDSKLASLNTEESQAMFSNAKVGKE